MKTEIIRTNSIEKEQLERAKELWLGGGLIAFPTETVYGLGADARNSAACAAIFAVKGRPADNPLIVHLYDMEQLEELAYTTPLSRELFKRFVPGPLTLVLKKRGGIPDIVSAGLDTAAFRFPSHTIARELLKYSRLPIAAPSANLSGKPSPTEAAHVEQDMCGRIPLIIDGGSCLYGLESTVLDISASRPVLLRPGAVTKEQLEEVCGEVQTAGAADAVRPAAPGMKYRHYAPRAEVMIAQSENELSGLYAEHSAKGATVCCLCRAWSEALPAIPSCDKLILGEEGDYTAFSHNLFSFFRYADERGAYYIIVQAAEEKGIGIAYMNRLRKAAAK